MTRRPPSGWLPVLGAGSGTGLESGAARAWEAAGGPDPAALHRLAQWCTDRGGELGRLADVGGRIGRSAGEALGPSVHAGAAEGDPVRMAAAAESMHRASSVLSAAARAAEAVRNAHVDALADALPEGVAVGLDATAVQRLSSEFSRSCEATAAALEEISATVASRLDGMGALIDGPAVLPPGGGRV